MKSFPPELFVDETGWCRQVKRVLSPNCDARPTGIQIDLLIIHNISLPPGEYGGPYVSDLFCNLLEYDAHPYFEHLRNLRVSAHFLVRRDGQVIQFVSANDRAWHAGKSSFDGRERCNDFSIGVELEGTDFEPFSPQQYDMLAALTRALQQRFSLRNVAGHEHIAPSRKTDPGPFFDWGQYQAALAQLQPIAPTELCFPAASFTG